MRQDLLALTDEDLATMSNIGSVRRARREVEEKSVTVELAEDSAGTVTARWSDGPTATLPGGGTLDSSRCTCPAVGTVCRHLVRTVISYQRTHQAAPVTGDGPWDPGSISDAMLQQAVGVSAVDAARLSLAEGILAEVVRSKKPIVRFIGLDLAVRFPVPSDLRYAHADLEGEGRLRLIAMAVLVARLLPSGLVAGVVATGSTTADAQHAHLVERVLAWVDQVLLLGAAGAPPAVRDAGRELETPLRSARLHALAELVLSCVADLQRYADRDALFAPEVLAEQLGEIQIRADVLRHPVDGIPLSLVSGALAVRPGDQDTGRFIGLGCLGRVRRTSLLLAAVVQDASTGSLATVVREHADPETGSAREAGQLASYQFQTGLSLQAIARGTLQSNRCSRAAEGRLVLGRGRHAVTPQAFAWERLRDPILVEDFAELRARLSALPPA